MIFMEGEGKKGILGRSSFFLQYFNPSTTKGKRNVVILCYAMGFIGLHAIWAHAKGNKTAVTDENTEVQTAS